MEVKFDRDADAVYIRFPDGEVEGTRKIDERTIADVDEDGEIIGIELLDVSNRYQRISELNIDFTEQATV